MINSILAVVESLLFAHVAVTMEEQPPFIMPESPYKVSSSNKRD